MSRDARPDPRLVAPIPGERGRRVSYWTVVGAQLRKNRSAMFAWGCVKTLILLGTAAPLVAFNVPILHVADGRVRLPLLHGLFDRRLFANGVDVFFNFLLVCGPLWLLSARAARAAFAGGAGGSVWARGWRLGLAGSVLLVEFLAAAGGDTALRAAVLAATVGAVILVAEVRRTARGDASRRRFAVWSLVILLLGGMSFVFGREKETSSWAEWRGPNAVPTSFAVFPPVPYHPDNVGDATGLDRALENRPSGSNWLGCDPNGRDVLARILFGIRISLTIGLVGVSIYLFIGIVLGSLAGYYGGKADLFIMRLVEVMICFPTMFLLLTIIAVFDSRSIFLIMAAIGLVGWPGVTRLVRGEFLRQRNLDYVTAARSQGLPQRRIIFGHVLPNCMGPVLVSATFGIAGAILTESGLAFLGLGDTSAVSWGQMLSTGRSTLQWHLILAPGVAIFFVMVVFNLLGEGLRDALDPKLRR